MKNNDKSEVIEYWINWYISGKLKKEKFKGNHLFLFTTLWSEIRISECEF